MPSSLTSVGGEKEGDDRSGENSGSGSNDDDASNDIGVLSSMAAARKDTHILPFIKLFVTLIIVCVCAVLLMKSLVQLIRSKCRGKGGGVTRSQTEVQAGYTNQYRVIYPSVQLGEDRHLIQSEHRGVTYSSISDERHPAVERSIQ